jgi:hypothetical protein
MMKVVSLIVATCFESFFGYQRGTGNGMWRIPEEVTNSPQSVEGIEYDILYLPAGPFSSFVRQW